MRCISISVLCVLLAIPSAVSAESSGAPMPSPGYWEVEGAAESLTIPMEGAFVIDARWFHETDSPTFDVEVTDAQDTLIAGEAEYDGRHGILFRASAPLPAGTLASAHVVLVADPNGSDEDITLDVAITVTDEATPALAAPVVTDLEATTSPTDRHNCLTPSVSLSWEPAAPSPEWLTPLLTYSLKRVEANGMTTTVADHVAAPMGTLYSFGFWPLRAPYCFRVVVTSLIDGETAVTEDCVTEEDYEATLDKGEMLCTEDNLERHEIDQSAPSEDDPEESAPASSSEGGCAGGATSPWGVAPLGLLLLFVLRRRRVTSRRLLSTAR